MSADEGAEALGAARNAVSERALTGVLAAALSALCAGVLVQTDGLPGWLATALLSAGTLGALVWVALTTDLLFFSRRASRVLGGSTLWGRAMVRLFAGTGLAAMSVLVLWQEWAAVAAATVQSLEPVW